jgi:hypothetical protein
LNVLFDALGGDAARHLMPVCECFSSKLCS